VVNELVIKAHPLHHSGDMVQQVRKSRSILKRLASYINPQAVCRVSHTFVSLYCRSILHLKVQSSEQKVSCSAVCMVLIFEHILLMLLRHEKKTSSSKTAQISSNNVTQRSKLM
jgi:hypothetical protein